MTEAVTTNEVVGALNRLGLAKRPLCVHASLRSFGSLASGADTVINAVLEVGATLLVPTSSFRTCMAPRPPGPARPFNAEDDGSIPAEDAVPAGAWRTDAVFVDPAMGALPKRVLERPGHVRGDHPLSSFSALGSLAMDLVGGQSPLDVYAPLRRLVELDGVVVTMGVGLDTVTLLHEAERRSGLRLLRRWALTEDGVVECEHGGCSRRFERLAGAVASAESRATVGLCTWRLWPAGRLLELAAEAFRQDPSAGRCATPNCARCRDIVAAAQAGHVHPRAAEGGA